jgi:quercetin dioxygenase-like cupin family protein
MQHWKLSDIDMPGGSRSPVVLHSEDAESRVVLIGLDPGQELGEHQVKEAAFLLVVDGSLRVNAGDEAVDASAGGLFRFEPDERRTVSSESGARLLLFLAPWPGAGHYRGEERTGSVSAS